MASSHVEHEAHLDQLAAAIARRGWQAPARLALESGRPLALLGSQFLWLAQPLLGLFISPAEVVHLARLLEEPAAVDALLRRLEAAEAP